MTKRFASSTVARELLEAHASVDMELLEACAEDEARIVQRESEPPGPEVGWKVIRSSHYTEPYGDGPYVALADALWGFVHA